MSKEVKIVGLVLGIVVATLGVGILLMRGEPTPPPPPEKAENTEQAIARTTPNVRGKTDSTVSVIEFGDLQCPACASVNPQVSQLFKEYGDKVKFSFRHFPLPQHKNALPAADAVEAAGEQGKFWEMLDLLYAQQQLWEGLTNPKPLFEEIAKTLNLDMAKFSASLNSQNHRELINQDKADGQALGNPGTPTFYINGVQVFKGGLAEVKQKIEEALKPK